MFWLLCELLLLAGLTQAFWKMRESEGDDPLFAGRRADVFWSLAKLSLKQLLLFISHWPARPEELSLFNKSGFHLCQDLSLDLHHQPFHLASNWGPSSLVAMETVGAQCSLTGKRKEIKSAPPTFPSALSLCPSHKSRVLPTSPCVGNWQSWYLADLGRRILIPLAGSGLL